MQILTFLNLQNSQLSIGDISFEANMQDNGLCIQSKSFDYLLDAKNDVIYPKEGEVYVPVAYKNEYDIKIGDTFNIGNEKLIVAGFLRDSQMNSMMASSKRFLVSEADYERLKYLGSEEYLIEFRLKQGSDVNAFYTSYKDLSFDKAYECSFRRNHDTCHPACEHSHSFHINSVHKIYPSY